MRAQWLKGPALSFDTETTGIYPATARIVSAAAIEVGGDGAFVRGEWLVNPDCEIPAEATAIHGLTTEMVRERGMPSLQAVPEIVELLKGWWAQGLPVIVMNAPFDLRLLQHEFDRLAYSDVRIGPVLDPLVIDRACDPYRKGPRNLTALAQHYGVPQGAAHSANGDALTAARVVWRQASRYDEIRNLTLAEMQAWQQQAHEKWAANFEAYLRTKGKSDAIDPEWPARSAA